MNNLTQVIRCLQTTLVDAWENRTSYVIAYLFISVFTLIASAILLYALQVFSSGVNGSLQNTPAVTSYWIVSYFIPTFVFLLLGCVTRRYWLVFAIVYIIQSIPVVYIFVGAATKGQLMKNWVDKLGNISLYGLLMVFVPAAIFVGLCKLAGIPLPQNNGWNDRITTDSSQHENGKGRTD